jgi:CRISPR-associated endonuclease Csn1
MEFAYGIGLDIGIASIGWSVVALDADARPYGLIKLGSRIFEKAEQPKTGESLALPRRTARGMRRRLRRKALRKQDTYTFLEKYQIADRDTMQRLFDAGHLEDVYALRVRALDEAVTKEEFARILLHLMQRRGFQSNRRNAGGEDGELLRAVKENRACMEQNGYRTVGEMLLKNERFAAHKRNKAENYLSTVGRDMVTEEARILFERQRELGCAWASPEAEAEYLSILLRQRTFDEGPAAPSPYAGNQVEKMVGRCTLEPDQPRAPKSCATFERFTLLQKVNHIRLIVQGKTVPLNEEQRQIVMELAYKSADVDHAKIRKALNLAPEVRFNDVRYQGEEKDFAKCEKKEKLPALKGWHAICKTLGKDAAEKLSEETRDEMIRILSLYKNDTARIERLMQLGFDRAAAEALCELNFSGFGHISLKACRKLMPYLEGGMTYDQACTAAGYDFRAHTGNDKGKFLPAVIPEMEDITSPVVRRSVAQTIKVVNAIIREQGHSPVYLNIELARELRKSFEERAEMDRSMQKNAAYNEQLMKEIRETFHIISPNGQDLVKYKLWKEQDGICAYSGEKLHAESLFQAGYAEVDHIIPYSISFDDSYNNKVLVLKRENQQKGNRLPLEYLKGEKRDEFIVRTNRMVRNYRKRQNLLKEKLTEEEQQGFKLRNLQDTQQMARFLLNFIRDYLQFEEHPAAGKQRVTALGGSITAHLRKRWGLSKIREDGDLHHALDATVIACATQGMIQEISNYSKRNEMRFEREYIQDFDGNGSIDRRTKEHFPAPWQHFRDEVDIRLSDAPQEGLLHLNPRFYAEYCVENVKPAFVSRMPHRKVTGAAHKETIKGAKALDQGIVTVKRALTELTLDKKTGEIANYYMPQSDALLYNALKERLQAFGGNAEKAFAEPFYKPKSDGTRGPLVRKVKLCEKANLMVPVNGGSGVANNDSMVRIDVFYVPDDGYYWVPIYVADTLKPTLPNRAVVAYKPYQEWQEMKDEDFIFSLYPNDLIEVEHKRKLKFTIANSESSRPKTLEVGKALVYYVSGNISVGSITIKTHDGSYVIASMGIKTLKSIKKFEVDVLGNYHEVKKEKRQTFRKK